MLNFNIKKVIRYSFLLYILIISNNSQAVTITLKPGAAAGKDAFLASGAPTINFSNHPELAATAWTCNDAPCNGRGLLQFDLSTIPVGAIITNARISLFAAPQPLVSLAGFPPMNGNNQSLLQRVTSAWNEGTVTWNTAPTITTTNQVVLTQSISSTQNYLNIDVKNMVQDMINNPASSFGFLLRLSTESFYTSMIFASSDNSNANLWPEITIEYTLPFTITTLPLSQSNYCRGSSATVSYTVSTSFNLGNVFTAQLSSSSGSFASPVNIGSVSSLTSGTISIVMPLSTAFGTGYRIRVVGSNPVSIGSDNGSNISFLDPDDNNLCTNDFCDAPTGNIVHSSVIVNDNNACTIDICDASIGILHISVAVDDNNVCTIDECNTSTGTISHTDIYTEDNNLCTTDGCNSVSGIFHNALNTDDNNPCTIDACNSLTGDISHTAANIDDQNACTADACNSSNGMITHVILNSDDDNACTFDGCDFVSGIYHNPVIVNDNNECTIDGCDVLNGVYHIQVNRDDNNACTNDACDPLLGVLHFAINVDDENYCTLDYCDTQTGVYHVPVFIDDGIACTVDACNTQTGIISHTDDTPYFIVSTDQILCYGGTACITISAAGGLPPYLGTGTFCGYTAGTYILEIIDSRGCVATSQVSIEQPPKFSLFVTSTPSGCNGNDGTATCTGSGGTNPVNCVWMPGGQTGHTATNLSPGNYLVTCTDANGCTATATVVVGSSGSVPTPPAAINGPSGVCAKQSGVVYCALNPDPLATSFIWTLPPGVSAVGAANGSCITLKFTTKFKGGFICVRAVTSCGTSVAVCQNISLINKRPVTPGGISGPSSLCPNQSATYSILPVPGATSYLWSGENMSILSGQGTQTILAVSSAGFLSGKIKVRSVNCKGSSAERKLNLSILPSCRVNASSTSKSKSDNELSVFPNPAGDFVTITIPSTASEKTVIRITDLTGKTVYLDELRGQDTTINYGLKVSLFSRGIYILSVQNESINKSVRLILE